MELCFKKVHKILKMVSRFLNNISHKVISEIVPNNNFDVLMLDVGFDDFNKFWSKFNTDRIIGVDSKNKNLDVLTFRGKHDYILTDAKKNIFEDHEFTSKIQKKYSFDIVTSFYSIERYFDSYTSYNNLMTNVSSNLKKGGYFVIIGFSGEKINTLLSQNPLIEKYYKRSFIWSIEKNYDTYDLNKPNFDVNIKYSVLKGLIKNKCLSNFDYIVDTAQNYNLEVISQKSLENYYGNNHTRNQELTKSELDLCFLNDVLVLKKY